jgi:hypothetical protein
MRNVLCFFLAVMLVARAAGQSNAPVRLALIGVSDMPGVWEFSETEIQAELNRQIQARSTNGPAMHGARIHQRIHHCELSYGCK